VNTKKWLCKRNDNDKTYLSSETAKGPACGKHPGYRVGCYCGNEASLDCRTMPGRRICDPKSDKFATCVPEGKQCGQAMGVKDTCEGSTLVFCLDGFKTRVDCTSLGFKGCKDLVLSGSTLGALCH
jgi:hypothetical protein